MSVGRKIDARRGDNILYSAGVADCNERETSAAARRTAALNQVAAASKPARMPARSEDNPLFRELQVVITKKTQLFADMGNARKQAVDAVLGIYVKSGRGAAFEAARQTGVPHLVRNIESFLIYSNKQVLDQLS